MYPVLLKSEDFSPDALPFLLSVLKYYNPEVRTNIYVHVMVNKVGSRIDVHTYPIYYATHK